MRKTIVVTDCGHIFKTGYTAKMMSGCTIDCKVCWKLLIFPKETTIGMCVRARDFNRYVHEGHNFWPVDGFDTYSSSIPL